MAKRDSKTLGVKYQDVEEDVAEEKRRRTEIEKRLVVNVDQQNMKQQRKLQREVIRQTLLGTVGDIEPHTDVDGEECICDQPHLHGHEDNHRDEYGRECMCDAPEEHEW